MKNHLQVYSRTCVYADHNNYKSNVGLKLVIERHLKILIFVRKIDTVYCNISFFQIVFSTIMICITGFVLITVSKKSYEIHK